MGGLYQRLVEKYIPDSLNYLITILFYIINIKHNTHMYKPSVYQCMSKNNKNISALPVQC